MSVYHLSLTVSQFRAIKLALRDSATWYEKHGGDDEWFALRAKENRGLVEYLDLQAPVSSSVSNPEESK